MQNALLNVVILGLFFLLFASTHGGQRGRRLKYWTFAWLLLLLNGCLALTTVSDPRLSAWRHVVHMLLLFLVGIFLLLSFLEGTETRRQRILLAFCLAVPAAVMIALVEFRPGAVWLLAVCIVGGEALAILQTHRLLARARGIRRPAIQVLCLVCGAAMLVALRRNPAAIQDAALTQVLLADAILLWTATRRDGRPSRLKTPGLIAACAGFLTWGVSFPVSWFLGEFFPAVVLSSMYWNFPKFFVAFGMILILHEDDAARARELSDTYRILFDHHPLPMWVFHSESLRFLRVNDAAVQHYGYTREQFAGMTIEQMRPADDLPRLHKMLNAGPRNLNRAPNWRHILSDGSIIEVDIFSHSISYERQPARIVVAIDVTKRNAAEEHLRQAYKLESLGQLTGGVAHDFNNILAIILGNLELIERQQLIDASGEHLVRQAISSVNRGADLTKHLLAYARQQPLTPRIVRVTGLLDDTVRFIKSSLGPTVHVKVDCIAELWNAEIDPGQLENALLNLAINARDAMGEMGEITIQCRNLHLEASPAGGLGEIGAGDYVVLSVADNGCGMSEEVILRATEPFFTTKPVGKGTGLGLSMVYGFLKQSGGHMRIESHLHAGTTVFLYLPRAVEPEPSAAPRSASPQAELPRGEEQILVVEDEHAIRTVLVFLLRSLGYKVLEAEDGPTALGHLERTPNIDLLLTDVVLPNGISGGLLANDARVIQPPIKVLFSSGYTRNVLIRDRRLEEGVHLLTKPFRLAELATTVRQVLDGS